MQMLCAVYGSRLSDPFSLLKTVSLAGDNGAVKQAITGFGMPSQSEAQVPAPLVRVLGGGSPWTVFEADAAELVNSPSSRVLIKARRQLRKIESTASNSAQQRQRLVDLIQNTQILRKSDSPTELQYSITQLRLKPTATRRFLLSVACRLTFYASSCFSEFSATCWRGYLLCLLICAE